MYFYKISPLTPGFTLIEVLISLFILTLGMLGMTALQNEALQYNHIALLDSQAQFLLADMTERIRSNRGNNSYAITYLQEPQSAGDNCEEQTCNSDEMALWDINQWREKVESTAYLPQGQSQILFNPETRTYIVSIRYHRSISRNFDSSSGQGMISVTTRI